MSILTREEVTQRLEVMHREVDDISKQGFRPEVPAFLVLGLIYQLNLSLAFLKEGGK